MTVPLGVISRIRLLPLLSAMSRWPVKGTSGGNAGKAAPCPGSRHTRGAGIGAVFTAGAVVTGTVATGTSSGADEHAATNIATVTDR